MGLGERGVGYGGGLQEFDFVVGGGGGAEGEGAGAGCGVEEVRGVELGVDYGGVLGAAGYAVVAD